MCISLYALQMWDLYSRERIDTKADIWVRANTRAIVEALPVSCGVKTHVNIVQG